MIELFVSRKIFPEEKLFSSYEILLLPLFFKLLGCASLLQSCILLNNQVD